MARRESHQYLRRSTLRCLWGPWKMQHYSAQGLIGVSQVERTWGWESGEPPWLPAIWSNTAKDSHIGRTGRLSQIHETTGLTAPIWGKKCQILEKKPRQGTGLRGRKWAWSSWDMNYSASNLLIRSLLTVKLELGTLTSRFPNVLPVSSNDEVPQGKPLIDEKWCEYFFLFCINFWL